MLSVFRAEAAATHARRQQLDHLLQTTTPSDRVLARTIGLLLLVAGLAIWAIFGGIQVGAAGHGGLFGGS